jgi:hypothetical protein
MDAVTREGVGRMGCVDIRFQWLYEKVLRNEVEVGVVGGVRGPADLLAGAVDKTCLVRRREALGLVRLRDVDGGIGRKVSFRNLRPSSARAVFFVPAARKIWQQCITVGAILAMSLSSVRAESNMAVVSTACKAMPSQGYVAAIAPWQLFGHVVINLVTVVVVLIIVRLCCRTSAEQVFVPLVTGQNDIYVTSQPSIVYHHKGCSYAAGGLRAKRPCKRCAPLWLQQDEVTAGM